MVCRAVFKDITSQRDVKVTDSKQEQKPICGADFIQTRVDVDSLRL